MAAVAPLDHPVSPLFPSPRLVHDADGEDARTRRAIARAAAGDREALCYLYERYSANVYRYVRSLVRDEHEAQDLTQSVFLKLMRILSRYDEDQGRFLSWLLRVAHNITVDHLRRVKPVATSEVWPADAEADEAGSRCRDALHEALAALSDEQRKVLVLRQIVGLRPGEIAEHMAKTEGSVHALHHRARTSMRTSLVHANAAPAIRRAGASTRRSPRGRVVSFERDRA
jgi:RNA polymerase sigma factor (sigma-70 family)